MALTIAKVKTLLQTRIGGKLSAAGMTGSDLDEPIGWALRQMGIYSDDPTAITDGDVEKVLSDYLDKLLDYAELRTLENISGNLAYVDISVGSRRESLSQLQAQVEQAIVRITDRVNRLYGYSAGVLTGGAIDLDFTEREG